MLLSNLQYPDLLMVLSMLKVDRSQDRASFDKVKALIASSLTDYLQLNTNQLRNA